MGMTILPTGFEGFGDSVSAGVLSGMNAARAEKLKQMELEAKAKEPKSRLDSLIDLMIAEKGGTVTPPSDVGEATYGEVIPQTENVGMRDGLSQAGLMDAYMKKKTGYISDPQAQREASIGALNEQAKIPVKIEEQKALAKGKEREKLGSLELAELTKKFGQSGRVVQAMRNLVGYGKTMDEANIPNWVEQLISKGGDKVIPFLPDDIQEKYGPVLNMMAQLEETKIGQVPIISGQARYVVDLANAIEKTQGQVGINPKIRGDLAAQSTRNMMTLVYGIQNGFTSVEKLKALGIDPEGSTDSLDDENAKALLNSIQLTQEQEAAVEEAVDYVLSAKPIRSGKMDKPKEQEIGGYIVEEL